MVLSTSWRASALGAVAAVGLGGFAGSVSAADPALIEAAKKEGALSYATNLFAPVSQKAVEAAFRKHYNLPDSFKVEAYTPSSSQVVARVGQEVSAKNVKIDWVSVNIASWWKGLKDQGELLEYCSPSYKGLDMIEKFGVVDGGCFYKPTATNTFGIMWNPKYVKEDLTTWAQLADPKYKGQIIFGDVRKSGAYLDTYIILRKNDFWTVDWMKKMKAQEPFFELRSTAIRDKVMTGEFPIAVFGYATRAFQVRDKVELKASYPTDGISVLGNYGGILKQAPHPNAAKLWVDFVYSKEGQEILMKLENIVSPRSDAVKAPEIVPYQPDHSKLKVGKIDWSTVNKPMHDKYRAEFREIFGN